jgi:hypothetical protein
MEKPHRALNNKLIMADQVTIFRRLQTIAYGFYLLVGITWVIMSFIFGHYFNYTACLVTAMFGVQAYHKNKLLDLLLGIVLLFLSVYSLFDFLVMGDKSGFDLFVNVMAGVSFTSIIMAGLLVFSYLKLSLADR